LTDEIENTGDKALDAAGREQEGDGATGRSSGLPSHGVADVGANEPIGRSGRRHWRESTITNPDLSDRGSVFFAAVEMTRMPMILTDPRQADNPIAFANKAFLDLTGYEEDEILGRNCRFLQGPLTDRETVAEMRAAIAARESLSVEVLNYRRDGSPFWNAVFIGPVYDTTGELLFFFASQLDVTRRKETERAYRQAQKMESIGQLTAGLAHDFNNLLQVVNGNLEFLSTKLEDPALSRYVDNARGAAERGAKLTRQLLAFARKTRLQPTRVNLSDLVHDFAPMIESSVGRQVDLQLNLRRKIAPVAIDVEQLEMGLLNIVLNARDALADGGLITISTSQIHLNGDAAARELPPGDYVQLEVADDGPGMPEDVLRRATEPFFTTKGVGKGTGLGLAMALGFVQQSRGRLEIESKPGAGTLVRMLFPVSLEIEAAAPEPVQTRSFAADGVAGRSHVLVVEDQPEVRALAEEILRAAGHAVTTAVDAADALARLEAPGAAFDLVFTDILMPGGMNGLVLAQEIAARWPSLPILLTTGYADDMVEASPERDGLDVIGKPYRRSELIDRVGRALERRPRPGGRRTPSDFGSAQA